MKKINFLFATKVDKSTIKKYKKCFIVYQN